MNIIIMIMTKKRTKIIKMGVLAVLVIFLVALVAGCISESQSTGAKETPSIQDKAHVALNYIAEKRGINVDSIYIVEAHVEARDGYNGHYVLNTVVSYKVNGVVKNARVIVDDYDDIVYADVEGVLLY